jgi:hypothetical protein
MQALSPAEQMLRKATVANKLVHREEHEVSRKPLRRECRDVSAEPVWSTRAFAQLFRAVAAGAASTRHSLHPLIFGRVDVEQNSGESRRGNVDACPHRHAREGGHPVTRVARWELTMRAAGYWIVRSSRTMTVGEWLFES